MLFGNRFADAPREPFQDFPCLKKLPGLIAFAVGITLHFWSKFPGGLNVQTRKLMRTIHCFWKNRRTLRLITILKKHLFVVVIACAGFGAGMAQAAVSGGVAAWGESSYGQTAVPVEAQSGVTAIAAGPVHTMALKSDGSVMAWGVKQLRRGGSPCGGTERGDGDCGGTISHRRLESRWERDGLGQ